MNNGVTKHYSTYMKQRSHYDNNKNSNMITTTTAMTNNTLHEHIVPIGQGMMLVTSQVICHTTKRPNYMLVHMASRFCSKNLQVDTLVSFKDAVQNN